MSVRFVLVALVLTLATVLLMFVGACGEVELLIGVRRYWLSLRSATDKKGSRRAACRAPGRRAESLGGFAALRAGVNVAKCDASQGRELPFSQGR
jgi:hypothetical protein